MEFYYIARMQWIECFMIFVLRFFFKFYFVNLIYPYVQQESDLFDNCRHFERQEREDTFCYPYLINTK